MRRYFLVLTFFLSWLPGRVLADEGMWLLSLVEKLNMNEMQEMGLQLTADQIYNINKASLKDAVGSLDHGSCTAGLVSPDGLILTNHHCGYDEIQHHSTLEHDYLKDGFWAMTREEELPNEGKTITFLIRMEEVTDQIVPRLNEDMSLDARNSLIRSLSSKIAAEALAENEYEAMVYGLYNDNRFFLFVTQTYRDVRLVGAPPESIGNFGGDTDNWEWPRQTCDFSIFRVYTGPDGKPADYSPDNIPLKSRYYLPVSLKGYEKGDFAMVLGFPGSTDRYMTSWEVEELIDVIHPNMIRIRGLKQKIMMEDMMASEKVRLQYAAKYSNSANYWKYAVGQLQGLRKLKVVEKKKAQEEAFTRWVEQDESRLELYGNALSEIHDAVKARRDLVNAEQHLTEAIRQGGGMESVWFARNLEIMERALIYAEEYPEEASLVARFFQPVADDFYKDYNPDTDRKLMIAMIGLLLEDLDDEYLPANLVEVKEKYRGNVEKYVNHYFKKSLVVDSSRFNRFLKDPSLTALRKDPAYAAYQASKKQLEIIGRLAEYDEPAMEGSRLYLKGLMEMYPEKEFYSDANSTMRLNYGTVSDYSPRDAVHYRYYTTLKGVMEKEDPGNFEFTVPDKLKMLFREKDYGSYADNGILRTCFTTDNDITGGNSGSPVLNGRGELIGLAFDGNWEAMSGDVAFEPTIQKCITVDIRYVLFIIDKYAGAGHLVREMDLVR
jgi:hypothetical protein